jgi:hypothetical protein
MVGKAEKLMGLDLDCTTDALMRFHWSTFSKANTEFNSYLAPCNFWAFPTMKRDLRGKKFLKWLTVCSTFSRSEWSVVRSARLIKGGTSKKRPSLHLH